MKILFFASLRERLGCAQTELETTTSTMTVADVKAQLIRDGDDTWQQVLGAPNILCAVNYEVVGPAHLVKHSDEIAFYPPVTGG